MTVEKSDLHNPRKLYCREIRLNMSGMLFATKV